MTNPVRFSTAVHEAGHAIVASNYGVRIVRMWIDPDDRGGGTLPSSSEDHLKPVDQIAIHRAGVVAQDLAHCKASPGASRSDIERIFKVFAEHGIDDDAREPLREEARVRAHAVLAPRLDKLIEIATALVEAGELDEPRIVELLAP